MAKLFLNTWIFEDAVKQGRAQADLVAQAERLGADGIEVRREYFKDLATELTAVRDAAEASELALALSIPDELFVNGAVALMSRLWTGFFGTARCRYPEKFSKPGFQPKMA